MTDQSDQENADPQGLQRAQVSEEGLRTVIDWVIETGELDDSASRVVQQVLDNHKMRIEAALVASAMHRINRLPQLLNLAHELEDRIMDPDRLQNSSTSELIRALNTVNNSIEKIFELSSELADSRLSEDLPKFQQVHDKDLGDEAELPDPRSRERVRMAVEALHSSWKTDVGSDAEQDESKSGT